MKKFKLFVSLLFTIAMVTVTPHEAKAQPTVSNLYHGVYLRDSVAASETGTLTFKSGQSVNAYFRTGNISVSFLKISGTPAASAKLYGSNNNSEWYLASDSTYTVGNVAGDQGMTWEFGAARMPPSPSQFKYWKVDAVATGGTQSFSMRGTFSVTN